jgi:hypothetical protein
MCLRVDATYSQITWRPILMGYDFKKHFVHVGGKGQSVCARGWGGANEMLSARYDTLVHSEFSRQGAQIWARDVPCMVCVLCLQLENVGCFKYVNK